MAVARWVRLELLGHREGLTWAPEIWTTGVNMTASDSGGDFVPVIRQPLPEFTANVESIVQDDGDLNIYWAWKGQSVFTTAKQFDMARAAIAYWNAIRTNCPTDMYMNGVRITAFDANKKAINGGNYFYLEPPIAGGTNATSQLPAQLAVVASLRTGARGAGGRGRMYLPLTGISTTSGKIAETQRTNVVNQTVTFLKALKTAGGQPSVVNSAKLQYSSVDRVAVGDYLDVQRKRRNAISEDYKEAAV